MDELLEKLENERLQLETELASTRASLFKREKQLSDLQLEVDNQKSEVDKLQNENDNFKKEILSMDIEIKKFNQLFDSIMTTLNIKNFSNTSNITELFKEKLAAKDLQLQDFAEKNKKLAKERDTLQETNVLLEGEIAVLNNTLVAAYEKYETAVNENEELKNLLQAQKESKSLRVKSSDSSSSQSSKHDVDEASSHRKDSSTHRKIKRHKSLAAELHSHVANLPAHIIEQASPRIFNANSDTSSDSSSYTASTTSSDGSEDSSSSSSSSSSTSVKTVETPITVRNQQDKIEGALQEAKESTDTSVTTSSSESDTVPDYSHIRRRLPIRRRTSIESLGHDNVPFAVENIVYSQQSADASSIRSSFVDHRIHFHQQHHQQPSVVMMPHGAGGDLADKQGSSVTSSSSDEDSGNFISNNDLKVQELEGEISRCKARLQQCMSLLELELERRELAERASETVRKVWKEEKAKLSGLLEASEGRWQSLSVEVQILQDRLFLMAGELEKKTLDLMRKRWEYRQRVERQSLGGDPPVDQQLTSGSMDGRSRGRRGKRSSRVGNSVDEDNKLVGNNLDIRSALNALWGG